MLFGLKGDVQGNLFYYDDQRVIYPAGHNVVIYNVDEKTQQYIPGKTAISALTVSSFRY